MSEFLEILKYTLPALVTAGVAAYFLKQMILLENNKKRFLMLKEKKQHSLPIRLQAYERMTLFLERIQLQHLVERITSENLNKIEYAKLLITHINSEFEHNLVQQIYVSTATWKAILAAKQTTLNSISTQSLKNEIVTGTDLQNSLIDIANTTEQPTSIALAVLHKEVQQLF